MKHHNWLAAHIFYPGDLDNVLLHLVRPLLRRIYPKLQQPTPYFFIRYWEEGSHIRLRLNATPDKEALIRDELLLRAASFFKEYPAGSPAPAPTVKFVQYIPETDRYGNLQSLPRAEHQFFQSSAFVLEWLAQASKAPMLIESLRMHLIVLCATQWDIAGLNEVCTSFIEGWLPRLYDNSKAKTAQKKQWLDLFRESFRRHSEHILPASKIFWKELMQGTADQRSLTFLQANTEIFRAYESIGFTDDKMNSVVSSMIHIGNNRLGISNYEEAYGMYCTQQCLLFIHKNQIFA
ncbi:thiopeptide-type bacteriocin biosynthesis protein [Sinomicrobium kalidii]|uniref:thiopeptide-type bacteriocin biosynthesis protein n=1 Tax=Sinomicrobium kalidii TaxID=2900738 RepID=UPI001E5B2DB1|nr:thiopeptide-type bacteriocin biosynthesis protein [Sinomicrobium kalidii]UGU16506.1 thiopeptide-type bacteriocin biosynthesis protein [Sinomicrobium kalidii]